MNESQQRHEIPLHDFCRRFGLRAKSLMWFLGAGASASAGIPTASDLIWEFKRDLFVSQQRRVFPQAVNDLGNSAVRDQLQKYIDSLGTLPKRDSRDEYAALFEAAYPEESDRSTFIRRKVLGADSFSLGHLVLGALMRAKLTSLVWTTNFDSLVANACAKVFDGTGNLTSVDLDGPHLGQQVVNQQQWPVEIKLHGDFRSSRLKNISKELRQQDALLRELLVDTCQRFGLVVIGYSGRDDSVMDTLMAALDNPSAFPEGLFWLYRRNGEPPGPVAQLLSKAAKKSVKAALVRVDSFDETLGDILRVCQADKCLEKVLGKLTALDAYKRLRPEFYLSLNKDELLKRYSEGEGIKILSIENNGVSEDLPVHVVFDNSKHGVSLCNIKTRLLGEEFTLDLDGKFEAAVEDIFSSYKKMLEQRGKTFFDGPIARLKDFSFCSCKKEIELWLQPVGYFTACKTQRILDAPFNEKGDTIRSIVHANGLEDLNQSQLANSIGYSTLLFTADNELIIQRRSKKVIAFESSLGPASSGAYDEEDFRYRGSDKGFPFYRETGEELGIRYREIDANSVRFLGITRELYRGGKPEMFFLAKTQLSKIAIENRRKNSEYKWESSSLIFHPFKSSIFNTKLSDKEKDDFRTDMTKLLREHMENMSDPLLSALALWQNGTCQ